jgi:hypothetical protein
MSHDPNDCYDFDGADHPNTNAVVERLKEADAYNKKHSVRDPLHLEAAKEIERLRAALLPFAEAADVFAREYPAMLDKPGTSCGIRFDALQAARTALTQA